ncbi:MAG: class I tRNA ligase family protein [candidate division KSB1 bacterium]|nr:class I tRNA ligase family protein [candidate division KSB1 bacterium]
MNELRLYNTATDEKQKFQPRQPGHVKLFTCGPSVYRFPHLGNYRTYLYEDVLQKYLEYKDYTVQRVINYTDVEDKSIELALSQGVTVRQLCQPVEERFVRECGLLNIDLPDEIPRASTSVEAAVDLIESLLESGHAYWHEGEVFFDPLTYKGFGRLYGLDMSNWPDKKIRFRQDTYPGTRWNRGDFILWHKPKKKEGNVWWETRIGKGRPAWNIQDAAMIKKTLGFEIDIHTGGFDNLYRHHDYTLAIMESASGKAFCPWWLHGGELLVDGEKMSKSKGNVAYLDDMVEKGFDYRHIRFFLLYAPYREKLDMCMPCVEERAGHLDRVRRLVCSLFEKETSGADEIDFDPAREIRDAFEEKMDDNLNVAAAFDAVADILMRAEHVDHENGLPAPTRRELHSVLNDIDRVFAVLGCDADSEKGQQI